MLTIPKTQSVYFDRQTKPGYKPVEVRANVDEQGRERGVCLSKIVRGPRGGVFMNESIFLTLKEWAAVSEAVNNHLKETGI